MLLRSAYDRARTDWRGGEIAGLLESLRAINYHSLAAVVAELTSD